MSRRCCATAQGVAALGVPLTLVVERPDGVEYRRSVGARPGRRRARARGAAGLVGADRHLARARLHRSEAPAGRRGDLHGRGLRARPARVRSRLDGQEHVQDERRPRSPSTAAISMARRPPSSSSKARWSIAPAERAAGLCRLSVRPRRRRGRDHPRSRSTTCRRPTTTARRRFARDARQAAGDDASARGAGDRAHGRARRPRGRAQAHAAGDRRPAPMIGVKPLFSGRSLGEGENADLRCRARVAGRQARWRATACATSCSRSRPRYQWYRRDGALGLRADQDHPARRRRPASTSPPTSPARISLPVQWGRYRLEVSTARPQRPGDLDRLRRRLVCRGQRRHAGPARDRARQAGIRGRATP